MIRVQVTQEHIDKGQAPFQSRALSCPIARALNDAGFTTVCVYRTTAYWGVYQSIKFSPKVSKFIYAADSATVLKGKVLKPFSFLVGTQEEIDDRRKG